MKLFTKMTMSLLCAATFAGARAAAGEAQVSSMVSQLDATHSRLDATTARLSNLEASLEYSAADTKQQLLEQQQAVAAATALATAAAERSTAATEAAANAAATAVAAAAAAGSGGAASSRGQPAAAAAAADGSTAVRADLLAKELAELRLQVGDLSATVAGMSRASRVAAALGSSSSRRHGDGGIDRPEDGQPGEVWCLLAASFFPAQPSRASEQQPRVCVVDVWGSIPSRVIWTAVTHPFAAASAAAAVAHCSNADSRALVPACEAGNVVAHAAADDDPSSLRAPSPELGEAWLPFMESTSACLAAHEAQIESLQVGRRCRGQVGGAAATASRGGVGQDCCLSPAWFVWVCM